MRQKALRIFLVSDDRETDQHLRRAFKRSAPHCAVTLVSRPQELAGAAHTPNLVLLDLMLRGNSPLEVLRWLRTEPRYTQVPVFVLGSRVDEDDVDEAYRLGANSCLLKDTEQSSLERIARAIGTYVGLTGGASAAIV